MKRSAFLQRRGSKFSNQWAKGRMIDRSFQSKAERDRADQLVLLEQAGAIEGLVFQPQTHLSKANIGYRADFQYFENGVEIYEDVKGAETEAFGIKKRLWAAYGPAQLRILRKGSGERFLVTKTIYPRINEDEHIS